jgi:Spy/CpxP family protein refolding chaperone
MKKVARFGFWGLAAFVLCSLGAGAQAPRIQRVQNFGPKRPPVQQALGAQGAEGRFWNNQRMIDQLKLTDDQRKTMDQVYYDSRSKLIDLHANVDKAELALQELMGADQPDQKAMEAQIDKIAAARSELFRANSRFLLNIRMKLTPDQWKQLRSARGNSMMGPNGPGPQGPGNMRRNGRDGKGAPAPPPAPGNGPGGPGQGGPGQGPGTGLEQ